MIFKQALNGNSVKIISLMSMLLFCGFIMVYSTAGVFGTKKSGDLLLVKELIYIMAGAAAMFFFAGVRRSSLQKYSYLFLASSALFLFLVLIFGRTVNGARRWFQIPGFMSFQPSEFAKLATIIFTADFIDRRHSGIRKKPGTLIPLGLIIGAVSGLILAEPDMGTAFLIIFCAFLMLVYSGLPLKMVLPILLAIALLGAVFVKQEEYRWNRVKVFFGGNGGASSQVSMAGYSFARGGLFGVGLADSKMKLKFLPESHTDFIFAIIGEEFGFAGTLVVIALYIALLFFGMRAVSGGSDLFSQMLGYGVCVMIITQAAVNIGVSISILPNKGLPLPFISYGGSSILFMMASLGVLLNVSEDRCACKKKK